MVCSSCQMQSSIALVVLSFQVGPLLQQLLQHLCSAKVGGPVSGTLLLLNTAAALTHFASRQFIEKACLWRLTSAGA